MKLNLQENAIVAPEADYLYIKKSGIKEAGEGLFTAIDIHDEEIIAVFKGEMLSKKLAKQRASIGLDKYFVVMPDGGIMDSMPVFCFAKYANDLKGTKGNKRRNNANIELNEEGEVCLVASREILSGAEIFCSYGKNYWKKHQVKK
jgi:hypothetical protein